jgi:AraC-like DNA-binding protein
MVALEVDGWLRERAPAPDLAGTLRCAWRGELARFRTPLPDECLDITWVDDGSLWLSGPESRSWAPGEPTGATAVGVRFAPAVGPAVVGTAAAEVCDARAPLAAVWGDRVVRELAERMALQPDDAGRARLLEAAVRERSAVARPPDQVARAVWEGLARPGPRPRPPSAGDAARSAGLSQRQLLRRCRAAFGYGPARLARVLRAQRVVHLARTAAAPVRLADVAATAGYVDQQHLTHDLGDLFGVTPAALLRPVSDRCKTATGTVRP